MDVFEALVYPLAVVGSLLPFGAVAVAWDCRSRNRWRSAVTFARIGLVGGFALYAGGFAVGVIGVKGLPSPISRVPPAALALLALGGGATVLCWWILQDARRDVPERRGP